MYRIISAVLCTLLAAPCARAMFMHVTEPVPLDRLLRNMNKYVKDHPDDAHGYYVLGRLHSLAYAKSTDKEPETLTVNAKGDVPSFGPTESIIGMKRDGDGQLTAVAKAHLLESIANYRKAAEKAPDNALVALGLGYMLEQAARYAAQLEPPIRDGIGMTAEERTGFENLIDRLGDKSDAESALALREFKENLAQALPILAAHRKSPNERLRWRIADLFTIAWQKESISAYRKAFKCAFEADLKRRAFGPQADSMISAEAAQALLRLLGQDAQTNAAEIAAIQKKVDELHQGSSFSVTPIIIPLGGEKSLEELLDPTRTVTFDLAGDGVARKWPWLKPSAGLLVWDPNHTGKIASGRQLFGSVSWWMFWQDGYEPLAMLDDDHDGWLTGKELEGISVWRDRNGNGVSDPGEVVPVSELDIEAIRASPDGKVAGTLFSAAGVKFRNGTTVSSYDWMPRSIGTNPAKATARKKAVEK